jgi:hypothetical protein
MRKALPILALLLLAFTAVKAQPAGWSYVKPFQVTENSGATLSNYQMKLYVDTQTPIAAGHMNVDGSDIRFGTDCPGTTLLNHWIEGPMNDDSTIIWVKLNSLPASTTTSFYMFYGNAGATTSSAIIGTFIGPHSSTDSVATGGAGGVGNSQRGFRFTANQDLLVGHFGKREPTGTTRWVTLFSYPGGAILRQMQVGGAAATYNYAPLTGGTTMTSPIWLTTGTQYVLELFQATGDGYYFGTSSAIGAHLTYGDMRYCNSCTQNTFPTSVLSNYHYGYPDFWYFTKQNVTPAPTAAWMAYSPIVVDAMDANLCYGSYDTLFSSSSGGLGATTCMWSPAFGLANPADCITEVSVASYAAYDLMVTDSLGCTSHDSARVFVFVSPTVIPSLTSDTICAGDTLALSVSGAASFMWSPASTVSDSTADSVWVFPTSTTTYMIVGADTAGCTGDTTIEVVVNPLPAVLFDDLAMCIGDPAITLSASPSGGIFSGSGVTGSDFDGTSLGVGTYTLSYFLTDSLGCEGSDSATATVNALPVVNLDTLVICDLDPPVTLTSGTPPGGTYSGPGISAGVFDPATFGGMTVEHIYTYTDSAGCTASDTIMQFVDICESTLGSNAWKPAVYPNPSTGTFTVDLPSGSNSVAWQVTSLTGQVVAHGEGKGRKEILRLDHLPAGVYLLHLRDGDARSTVKLQITH